MNIMESFIRFLALHLCLAFFIITMPGYMDRVLLKAFAQSGSETVVAEGSAPVISGDIVQARDEALADARLRAVEQAAGISVEAKAVFSQELMLDSMLTTTSMGFIQSEEILWERHEDGIFRLGLEAAVSPDGLKNRLRQLLPSDRIVIVAHESNLDSNADHSPLMNQLSRQLSRNGFENIIEIKPDPGFFSGKTAQDRFSLTMAEELAMKHFADIVIAGQISTSPSGNFSDSLYSSHASGWIRVFTVREGELLLSDYASGVRGFGPGHEQAGRNAASTLSDRFSEQVLNQIAVRSFWEMDVIFYDIPDFDAFKKYKNTLSLMRWVQDVKPSRFDPSKTKFRIRYAENPEILASRLDLFPEISVLGFSSRAIEIKVMHGRP